MRSYVSLLGAIGLAAAVAGTASPVPASGEDDTTVLVSRGRVQVTLGDYEAELQRVPEELRYEFQLSEKRIRLMLYNLLANKVLAKQARDLGLDDNPMTQRRMELAVDKVLAEVRMEHLVDSAPKPSFETLAEEQYKAYPEKYRLPEQVVVSHILISRQERSEDEARKLAEQVRGLALERARPFSELVSEYSDDPSAKDNQGRLPALTPGSMVKPFEEAAYALKEPGEISPVVETEFGFHIIRLEERVPSRPLEFDEVKRSIVKELEENYVNKLKKDHLEEIRSASDIEVNQEAIHALAKPVPEALRQ